ncbi:MAG: peptidoglycan editing factor PgeF [Ruminococcaceae bacterium]|nr:peptidoglycan editing factor PgeF [Oscillospiraceae bacterium]
MFYKSGIIYKSTVIDEYERFGVRHGFSAREGGVSTLPHTKSLNLTMKLGDRDECVTENLSIFTRAVTGGVLDDEAVVIASQIHSSHVRLVGRSNRGEGTRVPRGEDADGFCTDEVGVFPIVRVADCVPILLCGLSPEMKPIVAAVHAGWRGTVAGIAGEAVRKMLSLGAEMSSVSAAIGPHIERCCFEVGEDFVLSVRDMAGADFAARHISKDPIGEKYHADLASMNVEILAGTGVSSDRIDVSGECTMCDPEKYFSHRATGGKRGTQGAGIGII